MIDLAIRTLVEGSHLTRDEMREVVAEMMDGATSDIQKSAFLVALRMKGETPEEITGAAMAMRERLTPLDVDQDRVIDTCGTGGDGKGTFNVSTVAALVAAGAGAIVAKHGNRAVSSSCGSADLLAALGVDIELDARQASVVLRRVGIAFLFAPKLHPAMGAVAAVRRQLGIRTIFNLLGPLINPAQARRQVMGVYAPALVPVLADVLLALGAEHAIVVHSNDGLDEISISAPTLLCEVLDGAVRCYELAPEDAGLSRHPLEALKGGGAVENAAIATAILEGAPGAPRDIVLLNAAAALHVAGISRSIREGVDAARASIDSGSARRKLDELIAASREAGATA
ncbi:MAG TPA: anthranilate phosphoribosyltransferase [Thermoanaerobaculia bacterium]|nr:anthranilate phosphoribosyltransferase [Thermoanaerobaculia bacterium]